MSAFKTRLANNPEAIREYVRAAKAAEWLQALAAEALESGRPIQMRPHAQSSSWRTLGPDDSILNNYDPTLFRVQPLPTYMPYTYETFLAALRTQPAFVRARDGNAIAVELFNAEDVFAGDIWIAYEQLLRDYTWADGSPCGVATLPDAESVADADVTDADVTDADAANTDD